MRDDNDEYFQGAIDEATETGTVATDPVMQMATALLEDMKAECVRCGAVRCVQWFIISGCPPGRTTRGALAYSGCPPGWTTRGAPAYLGLPPRADHAELFARFTCCTNNNECARAGDHVSAAAHH